MPARREALRDLVARAYDGRNGATRLDQEVVRPAMGYSLFDVFDPQLGNSFLIGLMIERAERDGAFPALVGALLVALPADTALREWVAANAPDKLVLVSDEQYRAALERLVGDVAEGVRTLRRLLDDPAASSVVQASRQNIRQMSSEIKKVKFYKGLHDTLHNIQHRLLGNIRRALVRFPADTMCATELQQYADDLAARAADAGDRLSDAPDDETAAGEADWIGKLDGEVAQPFARAVEGGDAQAAFRATVVLKLLLRAQPPRLNALLVGAGRRLPLSDLTAAMATIADRLGPADPNRETLNRAAVALARVREELRLIIAEHEAWQRIESGFSQTEELIARTDAGWIDEFSVLWPALAVQVTQVCGDPPSSWAGRLTRCAQTFAKLCPEPIASPVAPAAPAAFADYVGAGRTRFYMLDLELKSRVRTVEKLSTPLDELVSRA